MQTTPPTTLDLRAANAARDRLSGRLRRCDVEMARALDAKDDAGWRRWLAVRADTWEQVLALDEQPAVLDRHGPRSHPFGVARSTLAPKLPITPA